jgi:RNA polymerase subunit RPABC4/transcription elongation factor Spt4
MRSCDSKIQSGENGHEKLWKKIAQQWSKFVVIKTPQKKISPKLYVLVPAKQKLYVLGGRETWK